MVLRDVSISPWRNYNNIVEGDREVGERYSEGEDMVREKYEGDRCNAVGCGGIRVEDTIGQGRTSRSPSPLMVKTCSFCGDHAGERREERSGENGLVFS